VKAENREYKEGRKKRSTKEQIRAGSKKQRRGKVKGRRYKKKLKKRVET
jgi:hypothetical protein